MGTMLYSRGVFINRCYDELNLTQPEMVRAVHLEYLQAGAEVIETNTFGANAPRLEHFGLRGRVAAVNEAGVRLARESVEQMREKQAVTAFVAGALGPLGVRLEPLGGTMPLDEAREAFAEQVRALARGGPGVGADLLIIETMPTLPEAEQALVAARNRSAGAAGGRDGVGRRARHLPGWSDTGRGRAAADRAWGKRGGMQLQRGSGGGASGHREDAAGDVAAARGHAERGHAAIGGWANDLYELAGVYGELCAQVCEAREQR